MINNIYVKSLVVAILMAALGLLIPQAAVIKLGVVLILAILLKVVLFDGLDFFLIYKKAKETATGAGMLFLGISIIISALIISGV